MNNLDKIKFAEYVIHKLANSSFWSVNTVDDIAKKSIELGLAETDSEGYYIEKEEVNKQVDSSGLSDTVKP